MRPRFFQELHKRMTLDLDIVALTADLGYGGFDEIQKDYPKQFINCGASEQAMMDIAVGLALSGKKVFTYTITPFYYRAFETLRTYINHEIIPVCMVGSGRDLDYKHDGFSHHAEDIERVLHTQWAINTYYPKNEDEMVNNIDLFLSGNKPVFISLTR